jgi:predicted short-subunit dehydrogenase-like oxidoreductase (DUF2520 family)
VREIVARDSAGSLTRARAVARSAGARAVTTSGAKLEADVLWLCVPDAAIAEVARALARGRDWRGRVALHSSGALASDELRALRGRGASVGSVHPMMTFAGPRPPQLRGLTFAVEGDRKAAEVARAIARDLGGELLAIRKSKKPLYHALGSFSSPLLVMLLSEAEQVGRAAGLSPTKTATVVRAILRRTLENYFRGGTAAAFSGPIRRGDLVTVKRHMKELRKVPGAVEVYRALARASLGRLPVGKRREMERLLAR